MVRKNSELKCDCCGKIFFREHYHGGSIEHDNYTNNHNMNVFVSRFLEANENDKYKQFKDSILLDGNLCNIQDNTYKIGLEIFECRLLWLKDKGCDGIVKYLEDNRKNIKSEFNKIKEIKIAEKQKEIDKLKSELF